MTYCARRDQLKQNHNVYGLVTDWESWQFAVIENSILHKSKVLFLAKGLPLIMQFLGRTLLVSALRIPTSSPLYSQAAVMKRQVVLMGCNISVTLGAC